ncbi:hypothetical protein DH26_gp089 [Chloriridovirus anopheles1]|uniref:Uncharacterized protein n=1 Tax=Chloriridovirus anopheles1 TaxID=1465751 RepID=W8QRG6_9VIRU|nr:hypothetical protein DH26_gp089 [Anopheles minimus iridovirus]AHL67582.1 hypothetical protein AMIV_089 [Anopheles minimus iridovirus]
MEQAMVNINFSVDKDLLYAIKNFMSDLSSTIVDDCPDSNFEMYNTIVKRIDATKVNSYNKLISGFKVFFKDNKESLHEGVFESLSNPNIAYASENGTFAFNFEKIFENLTESEQETVKDHLNHIWNLLNEENKSPEEKYIDSIFKNLKSKFSPDLSKDEQMAIAKELFNDFQSQKLDIGLVVKIACKKARELLLNNGSDADSSTLALIGAVEEIDVNNFNMVQFLALIGKVGTLFNNSVESNPLQSILANVFTDNSLSANSFQSPLQLIENETQREEVFRALNAIKLNGEEEFKEEQNLE